MSEENGFVTWSPIPEVKVEPTDIDEPENAGPENEVEEHDDIDIGDLIDSVINKDDNYVEVKDYVGSNTPHTDDDSSDVDICGIDEKDKRFSAAEILRVQVNAERTNIIEQGCSSPSLSDVSGISECRSEIDEISDSEGRDIEASDEDRRHD